MKRKRLFLVGGGRETCAGFPALRARGYELVVSDGSPQAPGLAQADEAHVASIYDVDATLTAARRAHARRPLDGVLSISQAGASISAFLNR